MSSNASQMLGVIGREFLHLNHSISATTEKLGKMKLAIGSALAVAGGDRQRP